MTSAFPPLTRADVLATSFSSWYPRFKKVAPKATVLKPLQADFIDYLESDRLFIPAGSGPIGCVLSPVLPHPKKNDFF